MFVRYAAHLFSEALYPSLSGEYTLDEKAVEGVAKGGIALFTTICIMKGCESKKLPPYAFVKKNLDQVLLVTGVACFSIGGVGLLFRRGVLPLLNKISYVVGDELATVLSVAGVYTVATCWKKEIFPFIAVSGMLKCANMVRLSYCNYAARVPV